MDSATAYLLMFVICVCLGLVTAKIAIYRGVLGSAFLWFIAGTILVTNKIWAAGQSTGGTIEGHPRSGSIESGSSTAR